MGKNIEKRPTSLLKLVVVGVISSIIVLGGFFLLFAAYETQAWIFWTADERLDQDTLFGVGRNAVTLAAALGVGVTLFFSYRKQQTAEKAQDLADKAQKMGLESQRIATATLNLSLDKHELERTTELRNRYARSAEQLASDKQAIQQAGIHSLASLADDWAKLGNDDEQQVCIALLCSFISSSGSEEKNTKQSPQTTATQVVVGRLAPDLVRTDKSWSSKDVDITAAPLRGTPFRVSAESGIKTFRDCIWGPTGANLRIEGGRIRVVGNTSEGTFPQSVSGDFVGGHAMLSTRSDEPGSLAFMRAKFLGSSMMITVANKQSFDLSFRDCQFANGRLSLRLTGPDCAVNFKRCTFNAKTLFRFLRPGSSSQIQLHDCLFVDDEGRHRGFSTEAFLEHIRSNTGETRTPNQLQLF